MRSASAFAVGLALLMVLTSCGGSSAPALFGPDIEGDWEISAASTSATSTDHIQVRLTQTEHDATGSGAVFYLEQNSSFVPGGLCSVTAQNSVAVTVANDGSLQLTLSEGDNTFKGSGHYGNGTMTGTYAETAGSACPDSGTWTARPTSPVNASFSGTVVGNPNILLQMQIKETAANHSVTATGSLSGGLVASFSVTGTYIGNAISGEVTVNVPNQAPLTKPVNIYYSPSARAIYIFEADGTFDGQLNQD